EYGRTNVFKVDPGEEENNASDDIVSRVGGRSLCKEEISLDELNEKVEKHYVFRQTVLTEKFNYKAYVQEKEADANFLYFIKPTCQIFFYADDMRVTPNIGDVVVSLTPPQKEMKKIQKKLENTNNKKGN